MKKKKEKKNPGKANKEMSRFYHEAKRGMYYKETRPSMVIEDKRRKKQEKEAAEEIRDSK